MGIEQEDAAAYERLKTRMTAGIDVFMDGVADDIEANAPKAPVPDLTIPDVAGVEATLKDVRFSKFERPSITYTLQEPNMLLAKVNVPLIELQGHAHAKRTVNLAVTTKTQEDDGDVIYTLRDATAALILTTDTPENGPPRVAPFDCQPSLDPAKLKALNFHEQFAIDLLNLSAKTFRTIVNTQLCSVLKKAMVGNANNVLSQVPSVFKLSKDVSLKGQITLAPTI